MSSYKQFVSNGIIEDGIIRDSAIQTSSIDMNNGVITNHNQPVLQSDVVNKLFVDNRIAVFTINLSGTSPTNILVPPLSSSILKGNLIINITSISAPNGPTATFHLSKSNSTQVGSIHRASTSAGTSSLERLMMDWNVGGTPRLYKTGVNYDGVYQVFLIRNSFLL